MLNDHQKELYEQFYKSTEENTHLDSKTEVLVGLAAAMAMDCSPCSRYYLQRCKQVGITRGELAEVLAKVMAVAAGQKRLQAQDVLKKYELNLEDFPD